MSVRDRLVGRWESENFWCHFLYNFKSDGQHELRFIAKNPIHAFAFTLAANGVNGEWWINSEGYLETRIIGFTNDILGNSSLEFLGVKWGSLPALLSMLFVNLLRMNIDTIQLLFVSDDDLRIMHCKEKNIRMLHRRK